MTDTEPGDMPQPEPPAESERRREPVFNLAGAVAFMIALCAVIHLARVELLSERQDVEVIVRFAFIPARYTGGYPIDLYSFVSPLTYSLLHGSLAHIVVNSIWLAAFGSPLANRIGTARFLLFWAATALGAVALHFALYPYSTTPLVGASGAISGMMGAAARFAFRIDRSSGKPAFGGPILRIGDVLRSRQAMAFLIVWLVINVIVGLGFASPDDSAQIAWEAHIGGLLVGFFAIRFFDRPWRGAAAAG